MQTDEAEQEEATSSGLPSKKDFVEAEQAGCLSVIIKDLRQELGALKEGWLYAFGAGNR